MNAKALTKTAEELLNRSQNKFNLLAQACGENNMIVMKQLFKGYSIKSATDFTNSMEKMVSRQVVIDLVRV